MLKEVKLYNAITFLGCKALGAVAINRLGHVCGVGGETLQKICSRGGKPLSTPTKTQTLALLVWRGENSDSVAYKKTVTCAKGEESRLGRQQGKGGSGRAFIMIKRQDKSNAACRSVANLCARGVRRAEGNWADSQIKEDRKKIPNNTAVHVPTLKI